MRPLARLRQSFKHRHRRAPLVLNESPSMGLPFRSRARSPFKSKSRRSGASPPDLRRFGKGRRRQQPAPVTILRSPGGGTSLNEHQNRARKSHPQANQWPRACGQVLPARSPWRHDRRRFPASSSFLLLHPPPRRFERTIGGIGAGDVSPRLPFATGLSMRIGLSYVLTGCGVSRRLTQSADG